MHTAYSRDFSDQTGIKRAIATYRIVYLGFGFESQNSIFLFCAIMNRLSLIHQCFIHHWILFVLYFCYVFVCVLPLERNPTSISLASIKIRGMTKQNADTRWMKGAVGPP